MFGDSQNTTSSAAGESATSHSDESKENTPQITTVGGNASERCMSPTMVTVDPIAVIGQLNLLRNEADRRACKFNDLAWNSTLQESSKTYAMTCPMANYTKFEGNEGNETTFARIVEISSQTIPLEDLIQNLTKKTPTKSSDGKLVHVYAPGVWDPAYQIVWNDTRTVGCALVSFTNSDLKYLSEYFFKNVTEPMKLQSLVCEFYPPGCVHTERVYNICNFTKDDVIINRTRTEPQPIPTGDFKLVPTLKHLISIGGKRVSSEPFGASGLDFNEQPRKPSCASSTPHSAASRSILSADRSSLAGPSTLLGQEYEGGHVTH
ncbi:hypothetical protein GE061_003264 [Apolygus lucorum]|uniref:SCP domain-containing protein n=1 Tax=Apolygus lucorum TaxID=248454 RepID=A0A8S9X320_APOLU|nr:hypothetical protein GE061_003264 [Apolygus lucorum]